jgi:hypothetical protein
VGAVKWLSHHNINYGQSLDACEVIFTVLACSSHDSYCAKLNSKMTACNGPNCLLYPSNAHVVSLENKGKQGQSWNYIIEMMKT